MLMYEIEQKLYFCGVPKLDQKSVIFRIFIFLYKAFLTLITKNKNMAEKKSS